VNRILVLGSCGAGKTVFARHLGEILDLPVAHLDELRYDPDWAETAPDHFAAAQRELLRTGKLIVDGNYLSTLPERLAWADTVIWLDYHPLRCLWRVIARYLRYGAGQHGKGIYVRLNRSLLAYVATYRRRHAPRVRATLEEHAHGCNVIVLRRPRATTKLLHGLTFAAAR
jgi:adenylate kinase family enzyme